MPLSSQAAILVKTRPMVNETSAHAISTGVLLRPTAIPVSPVYGSNGEPIVAGSIEVESQTWPEEAP